MKRARLYLPAGNLVLFVLVVFAFVGRHGGIKGDYDLSTYSGDVIAGPGDMGLVFLNRWQFGSQESVLTKRYMFVNLPALAVAKVAMMALASMVAEFQAAYPFGLSIATYPLILGFLVSLLQWYGIGIMVESLAQRKNRIPSNSSS